MAKRQDLFKMFQRQSGQNAVMVALEGWWKKRKPQGVLISLGDKVGGGSTFSQIREHRTRQSLERKMK